MTNLEYLKEIVNSEDVVEKLTDLFVNKLEVNMELFDIFICKQCPYHEQEECPDPCAYSDEDEVRLWLEAEFK